jgi:DNA polymerase III subunit beta
MNISCDKNKLIRILSVCINAINEKSNMDSLKCFKLETSNNLLIVTGNNLKTNIIGTVDAQIDTHGITLVHARTFFNIISKLPTNEVTIYLSENNTLIINSGESTFNIFTANPDEYPDNMVVDEYKEIFLNKDMFIDMVKRVSFSASDEEEKVILNGVLVEVNNENNQINFVAADGYRLAKDTISFENNFSMKVIIPIKTIKEVLSICSMKEVDKIKIRISDDKILFVVDDIQIFSRLINGQFPDYNLLIPQEKNLDININRKNLLDACERINIIAHKNSFMVKVEIIDSKIILSSVTPDFGDGSEKLNIKHSGDNNISVVFNVKLLIDVLKNLETENINIEIINDEKPLVIKEENNNEYVYIMMPIKVKR